ncbi:hypothetical protein [uncultured Clostridium sp.]|uniref:hypothetical protein n=1 Tax=uncultured Clostridium sp. TaxID=59620 RepID=UPI00280B9076|nr:hypothetical protein [uncultured Clostridium sp.]
MTKLIDVLKEVKEKALKHYEELKSRTNDDEGKEMIVFTSRTIHTRNVSDIREEDTDEFIGITNEGWIVYKHDIQYFGGPIKISNESFWNIEEEKLIKVLEEYSNDEYVSFISKVSSIYDKYR